MAFVSKYLDAFYFLSNCMLDQLDSHSQKIKIHEELRTVGVEAERKNIMQTISGETVIGHVYAQIMRK